MRPGPRLSSFLETSKMPPSYSSIAFLALSWLWKVSLAVSSTTLMSMTGPTCCSKTCCNSSGITLLEMLETFTVSPSCLDASVGASAAAVLVVLVVASTPPRTTCGPTCSGTTSHLPLQRLSVCPGSLSPRRGLVTEKEQFGTSPGAGENGSWKLERAAKSSLTGMPMLREMLIATSSLSLWPGIFFGPISTPLHVVMTGMQQSIPPSTPGMSCQIGTGTSA
mmetsp:Transcript_52393/g.114322  ORF Transcript_52393/g.114322 Transcript_52393/m.114322 type:complete len:222 (+) Transcript_52393:440-1105(+)